MFSIVFWKNNLEICLYIIENQVRRQQNIETVICHIYTHDKGGRVDSNHFIIIQYSVYVFSFWLWVSTLGINQQQKVKKKNHVEGDHQLSHEIELSRLSAEFNWNRQCNSYMFHSVATLSIQSLFYINFHFHIFCSISFLVAIWTNT